MGASGGGGPRGLHEARGGPGRPSIVRARAVGPGGSAAVPAIRRGVHVRHPRGPEEGGVPRRDAQVHGRGPLGVRLPPQDLRRERAHGGEGAGARLPRRLPRPRHRPPRAGFFGVARRAHAGFDARRVGRGDRGARRGVGVVQVPLGLPQGDLRGGLPHHALRGGGHGSVCLGEDGGRGQRVLQRLGRRHPPHDPAVRGARAQQLSVGNGDRGGPQGGALAGAAGGRAVTQFFRARELIYSAI
mmetsp:Transcript_16953/g.53827  ORF Transcript_16953/g.53827 Transcript_16953/m.53827 type:complete len:243 (-) Transcript_16953:623-1351(-)